MSGSILALIGGFSVLLLIGGIGILAVTGRLSLPRPRFLVSDAQTAQQFEIQKEANLAGLGIAGGAGMVLYLLWGFWWLGLIGGALALSLVPSLWQRYRTAQALETIDLQLPLALQLLGNSFKANRSLLDCIGDVATNAPEPISLEFAQIAREGRTGGAKAALRSAWRRLPVRNFRTTVVVLQIVQDRGGDLAATATELADAFRAVHKLESMSKTASQQTRAAMGLVTAAPIGILGMMVVFQEDMVELLFGTPTGWAITGFAVALYTVSMTMMRKLTSVQI